ncbi:MAG: hypothetical protein AAGA18_09475 [Verrucomicrobiota bacterium]
MTFRSSIINRFNVGIKFHITYPVHLLELNPEQISSLITSGLDACGLPHNVFQDDLLTLLVRSSDGILGGARNFCHSAYQKKHLI